MLMQKFIFCFYKITCNKMTNRKNKLTACPSKYLMIKFISKISKKTSCKTHLYPKRLWHLCMCTRWNRKLHWWRQTVPALIYPDRCTRILAIRTCTRFVSLVLAWCVVRKYSQQARLTLHPRGTTMFVCTLTSTTRWLDLRTSHSVTSL